MFNFGDKPQCRPRHGRQSPTSRRQSTFDEPATNRRQTRKYSATKSTVDFVTDLSPVLATVDFVAMQCVPGFTLALCGARSHASVTGRLLLPVLNCGTVSQPSCVSCLSNWHSLNDYTRDICFCFTSKVQWEKRSWRVVETTERVEPS